jgi:LysM repeat protein
MTPGKWLIAETIKSGWTPITPASVYITLDQYAPPGATDPVIFKNLEPVCYASITVEKNGLGTDANGGQVWLGPLAGWHITLSRADGAMTPVTMATDGTGKVVFKNLKPGVYNVKETVQPGWEAISPNPQQVIIRDCESARVLFENLEVVGKLQISGTKYFRAWVPPYQGVTVGLSGWHITATLKGTNPSVYVTTTTDALGNYRFNEATLEAAGMAIPGATITVCEEKRFHWIPVTPVCVDVRFPYPVPVDYKGAVVNFTNVQDPPLPGASTGGSVNTATCSATYTVRAGDNLSSIAATNGTSVSALVQLNGLANPNMIRAGQTLCIQ